MSNNKAAKIGAAGLALAALLCAAIAAMFVGRMLTARGYTGKRVVAVVVATKNLSAAQRLSPDDLKVIDWPEGSVPDGAFTKVDALFVDGKKPVTSAGVLRGEPMVRSRLASSGSGTGIARLISPNMRAMALRVEDAVGKTNLVYPGAYVDVIVTIRVRDEEVKGLKKVVSRTAVERARVLTVGTRTDVTTPAKKKSKKSTTAGNAGTYVTLEVTPLDAEILAIARNEGNLNLVLRNSNDESRIKTVDEEGVPLPGSQATTIEKALGMDITGASTDGRRATSAATSRPRSAQNRTRSSITVRKSKSSSRRRGSKGSSSIETYRAPN